VYCRCSTSPASRRPTRGLHARWGRAPAGAHPRRLSPPQRPGQQGCGGGGVRRNERSRTCPPRRRQCVYVRWIVAGAIGAIGIACLAVVGRPDRPTQEAKRVGRRVRAGAALWGYKKGHARGLAPSGRREKYNTHLYPCARTHPTSAAVPALTRAHYRDKDKTTRTQARPRRRWRRRWRRRAPLPHSAAVAVGAAAVRAATVVAAVVASATIRGGGGCGGGGGGGGSGRGGGGGQCHAPWRRRWRRS